MRRGLLRDAGIHAASSAVAGVAALGGSIVIARQLGAADMGRFSAATQIILLGTVAATLGLPLAVTRAIARSRTGGREVVRGAARLAAFPAALIAGICGICDLAGVRFGLPAGVVGLAGLVVPAAAFAQLTVAGLAGGRLFALILRVEVLVSLAQLAAVAAVAVLGGGILMFLVPTALTTAWYGLLAWRSLPHPPAREPGAARPRLGRDAAAFSLLVVLGAGVTQRSQVLLLAALSTHRQAAYFALAYTLVGRTMALLPGAVEDVLLPHLAGAPRPGQQLGAALRWLALLAFPLGALFAVAAVPAIHVLYGGQYAPVASALLVLGLAGAVGAIAAAASSAAAAIGRRRALVWLTAASAVTTLVLGAVLAGPLGALGAALAVGAGQLVMAVGMGLHLARTVGLELPLGQLARIGLASGVAAGAGIAVGTLPDGAGLQLAALAAAFAGAYVAALRALSALPGRRELAVAWRRS